MGLNIKLKQITIQNQITIQQSFQESGLFYQSMQHFHDTTSITPQFVTYRNAIYNGMIDSLTQTRSDFGMVYLPQSQQFVCCNNWHNDCLEGETLFFNGDAQYSYGMWIANRPQGLTVWRNGEVVVIVEFNRGKLVKGGKILVLLQSYNVAVILIISNSTTQLNLAEYQLYEKQQFYTFDDIKRLFQLCDWPQSYFSTNQTLIKYITKQLLKNEEKSRTHNASKNEPKLRLVENKYYRLGYDEGLAILFDEEFRRVSVGWHVKNQIVDGFGERFSLKEDGMIQFNKNKQRQQGTIKTVKNGLLDNLEGNPLRSAIMKDFQLKTGVKPIGHTNQNPRKINSKSLLIDVNFCNKFYKNPSTLFQFYIQSIFNHQIIQNVVSGSMTTRRLLNEDTLGFSKIDSQNFNNQSSNFNPANQSNPVDDYKQEQFYDDKSREKTEKKAGVNERLRLQAIKLEIYDSLEKRKHRYEKKFMDSEYEKEIIRKDMVGRSIYDTPERNENSRSRSRKRIFEESDKNIKLLKDFTPSRSQPQLTAFKAKMKNRIFNGQQSNVSERKQAKMLNQTKSKKQLKIQLQNSESYSKQKQSLSKYQYGGMFSSQSSSLQQQKPSMIHDEQERSQGKLEKSRGLESSSRNQGLGRSKGRQVSFEEMIKESRNNTQNGKNRAYVPIDTSEVKRKKRQLMESEIKVKKESIEGSLARQVSQQFQRNQQSLNSTIKQSKKPSAFTSQQQDQEFSLAQLQSQNAKLLQPEKAKPRHQYYLQSRQEQRQQTDSLNKVNETREKSNQKSTHRKNDVYSRNYKNNVEQAKEFKRTPSKLRFDEEAQAEGYSKKNQAVMNQETFGNRMEGSDFYRRQEEKSKAVYSHLDDTQKMGNTSSKKSAFRHSNQVYLDQFAHKYGSPSLQEKGQYESKPLLNNYFMPGQQKNISNHTKKSNPISTPVKHEENVPPSMQKQRSGAKSSYMQKHIQKKSIERDIEASPDAHRCYGRQSNKPYLAEESPGFSNNKEYSYSFSQQNSYNMGGYDSGMIGKSGRKDAGIAFTGNSNRGRLF